MSDGGPVIIEVPVKEAIDDLRKEMRQGFRDVTALVKEQNGRVGSLERSRAWGRGVAAVLGSGLVGTMWAIVNRHQ